MSPPPCVQEVQPPPSPRLRPRRAPTPQPRADACPSSRCCSCSSRPLGRQRCRTDDRDQWSAPRPSKGRNPCTKGERRPLLKARVAVHLENRRAPHRRRAVVPPSPGEAARALVRPQADDPRAKRPKLSSTVLRSRRRSAASASALSPGGGVEALERCEQLLAHRN